MLKTLEVPADALIVLIAPSGAGKSTFARRYFRETEIVSSDHCRALVSDDEADQRATVVVRTSIGTGRVRSSIAF